MPFYPGPGLGGHCIPVDPFYLSWKARQSGFECRFIELAGQVNGSMPECVVQRISEALNSVKKPVNGSRIHLFGIAYKRDVGDLRESPALDIIELLARRGSEISYTNPYVPELMHGEHALTSVPFDLALSGPLDCAVVTTDHAVFDYGRIASLSLVVDTRNALRGLVENYRLHVVGLCSPETASHPAGIWSRAMVPNCLLVIRIASLVPRSE